MHYCRVQRGNSTERLIRVHANKGHECRIQGCSEEADSLGLCPKHYSRLKKYGSTDLPPMNFRNKGKTCKVAGCDTEAWARGYCQTHYSVFRIQNLTGECSVDGCRRPVQTKGLCEMHYARVKRSGTTERTTLSLLELFFGPDPKAGVRECPWCGREYEPRWYDQITCGRKTCQKIHQGFLASVRRAILEDAPIDSEVSPIGVFERDGWRCQACGVNTPPDLRGRPVPNAPELDHIVAVKDPAFLEHGHTWNNLQTLCRRCNKLKGNHSMEWLIKRLKSS